MKEKRKAANRKYYERNQEPEPKKKAKADSQDVRRWKCTMLSRNNGLTPRPLTMSTEGYLEVHEKAQMLIDSMGYDNGDKKQNALRLIMNESIRTHIDEVNQQQLASQPRPTATTARASALRAAHSSSPAATVPRGTRSSPPDVWVPLVMALLSVLANGRTSETILNTLRTHLTTITAKIIKMRERRAIHPDSAATGATRESQ